MKRILLLLLLLVSIAASAQSDTLKYRVSLRDKAATTYSMNHPHGFLSNKAIARRAKQQLAIDSTDLPVCRSYIEAIERIGVKIVVSGKWDNFVTVSCNDTALIEQIAQLPFVRTTERVWIDTPSKEKRKSPKRDSLVKQVTLSPDTLYGSAMRQLQLCNGYKLHEAGFKGQGLTIAVIDAGFHNVDRIALMKNIRVAGIRDFVDPTSDIYAEHGHGTSVLSCMAMNQPSVMIGTAPEASYWLLRSEDASTENLVEQDYWAAAIEFADSVGVDVVSTSLGYHAFADSSKNYRYCDLDGRFALMSRQASRAADKGIIVVCSAGNSGAKSWKKIAPPADANEVLTVGAVDLKGVLASFSSVGNTADGRIKPDVVAVGSQADVITTAGEKGKASGTSFAAPILCGMVACLWQALPQLSVREIMERVRRAGNRADCPDNIYGYGIPDMWKAYQLK